MNIIKELRDIENKIFETKNESVDLVGAYHLKENLNRKKLEEMINKKNINGVVKLLEYDTTTDYLADNQDDYQDFGDDPVGEYPWSFITSKSVKDYDGFWTDYSVWMEWTKDDNGNLKPLNHFVFIFGDNDVYDPHNSEPDWECDSIEEAQEWFDNYNGFEEDEDINESLEEAWKDIEGLKFTRTGVHGEKLDDDWIDYKDYLVNKNRLQDEMLRDFKEENGYTRADEDREEFWNEFDEFIKERGREYLDKVTNESLSKKNLKENIDDDVIEKIKQDLSRYYKDSVIDTVINIINKSDNKLQLAKDLTSLGIRYYDVKNCILKHLKAVNESFNDMKSAYDKFDKATSFANGKATGKPSKEIRRKQARRNELRNKQFSDGLTNEETLELNKLTKELIDKQGLDESLDSNVTTEDIIDWMYDHDQATDDCLNHFNVDDLYSIETEALIDWISYHDELANDFERHFGISPDEWLLGSDSDDTDYDSLDLRLTADDMNAGQWYESLNKKNLKEGVSNVDRSIWLRGLIRANTYEEASPILDDIRYWDEDLSDRLLDLEHDGRTTQEAAEILLREVEEDQYYEDQSKDFTLHESTQSPYKLRFYKLKGSDKGNLDHEEFFNSKEDAVKRYRDVFKKELFSLNPTVWELRDGDYKRLMNHEITESSNKNNSQRCINETLNPSEKQTIAKQLVDTNDEAEIQKIVDTMYFYDKDLYNKFSSLRKDGYNMIAAAKAISDELMLGESCDTVTKTDYEGAKITLKKSTNPSEIKKAQQIIKCYKEQNSAMKESNDNRVGQKYKNANGVIIQITDPQKNGKPQFNIIRDGKVVDCKAADSYEALDKILKNNGYKLVEK